MNVYAWVDGDTIYVESKFSGGKKVKSGKIVVIDPQGVELLSGLTNDEGEFSFKVPKRTDLKSVLIVGQGHQGEWTLRADEMKELPSQTALETSAEIATPSEGKETVSKTVMDHERRSRSGIAVGCGGRRCGNVSTNGCRPRAGRT